MQNQSNHSLIVLSALLSIITLVGCSTTAVKSERMIPAEYEAGATLKSLAILPFTLKGKADDESTSAIVSTVSGVRVDGQRYFQVAERARLASVINEQKYARTGQFDQKSAVEIGKKLLVQSVLFGEISDTKVTRKDRGRNKENVQCYDYGFRFQSIPRFVNVKTGRIEFAPTIAETATQYICGGQPDAVALRSDARNRALQEFKNKIAPRRISETVKLLTKYCEPDGGGRMTRMLSSVVSTQCDDSLPPDFVIGKVNSGEKFADSGRMDRACALWEEAASEHDAGYNLPYLLGVCAESKDADYAKALRYYQIADERTTEPVEAINDSLARIKAKSSDLAALGKKPKKKRKPDPKTLNAQKSLAELGYDPGPADGFMGKKTGDAIREFQLDNGLDVTGKLDRSTINALGL